ncbi:hypothetical protein EJ02DRAFT_427716 [Clathrospora elynae]|uniref:Uncharacterized protein n=1 Tax=Clathrospora elynae TaxID=706981 RepID=A0A6A5S6I0_9PLEO|nr:hypothetical protein EJ02DRAFT_427716 [Clathrospora elynae]
MTSELHTGDERYAEKETLQRVVTVLDIEEPPEADDIEIDQVLGLSATPSKVLTNNTAENNEVEDQLLNEMRNQRLDSDAIHRGLLTPEATPEPRLSSNNSSMPGGFADKDEEPGRFADKDKEPDQSAAMPLGWQGLSQDQDIPNRRENNAPRQTEISSRLDESNIIQGTGRTRRNSRFPGVYVTAFADALNYPEPRSPKRLHCDQLPPPPKHWKDLEKHLHGTEFYHAATEELDSCFTKLCFAMTSVDEADIQEEILPLMWVFTYKFDEDGYLFKYKAWLVVRGDLQEAWGDTYAATLAA